MQEITPQPATKLDDRLAWVLLPLLALGAILPLILHGCSCGHDFTFHLINWFDAMQQLKHGTLFPHWAYSPAWNAGEPRFIFYPPISWALGELLGLIYWPGAYIAYTWLSLAVAGLAFHRLARVFAAPNQALLAAVLYMVNPYMLFTAYERAAYGELLSSAWICLLLLAILRPHPRVVNIAIPIALLWFTDAPAAVIGCYLLAFVAAFRFAHEWATTGRAAVALVKPFATGTVLGLALAADYIIPAAWERAWIQIRYALTPGLLPQSNFLFGHTPEPEHDAILHMVSVFDSVMIFVAVAILLALWFSRRRPSFANASPSFLFPTLAITTALLIFLQLPPSRPVWAIVPQLEFLQFPWRLLIVLAPIAALALALLLSRIPLRPVRTGMTAVLLGCIFIPLSIRNFRQICFPEDTPAGVQHSILGGFGVEQDSEYTPNGASNTALQAGSPAYWLSPDPNNVPDESADDSSPPLPSDFLVESPLKQYLVLNLRDYPAWRVRINGQLLSQVDHRHRDDGRIAVPIIAGLSTVNIAWANTPDVTLGRLLSLLALARLLFLLYGRRLAHLSSTEQ